MISVYAYSFYYIIIMNKFEEDLKYASTIKGGDFMGWL
jgi:hypothetical protein